MRVPPVLLQNLLGLAALTVLLAACFGGDDPDERADAATATAQSSPSPSPRPSATATTSPPAATPRALSKPAQTATMKKLTASDAEANDFFGSSVAVSGDTAVVGALREDSPAANAGAAYVLQRDDRATD